MANTFQLISAVTVGSGGASSIDFTSIPATWTDLQLAISVRSDVGSYGTDRLAIRFNGDTGNNYSWKQLQGFGSFGIGSQNYSAQSKLWAGLITDLANTAYSSTSIYIPNYAGSAQKSVSTESVGEANQAPELMVMVAGLWSGTSAISSISIFPNNTSNYNFNQYSTAYLYGIKSS